MSDHVFVVCNQLGQFWTRSKEWVDGREPQRLMKFKHRDEAVNQLVELSAKDIELRGSVLGCLLNDRKDPAVEPSEHLTPTLAERAAREKAEAAQHALEEAQEGSPRQSGETGDGQNDTQQEPAGDAEVRVH